MRTRLLIALAAALGVAGVSAPVSAVTNGQPDNGAHPNVGIVVFYDASGTPTHRCTGTMISAKTLLTAGHCTIGTTSAQVWFSETASGAIGYPFTGGFTGTPVTYSGYTGSIPNTGDIGVVRLDHKPRVGTSAIAPVGYLDSLATRRGQQNVEFVVVGYGLQEIRPTVMADRNRLKATVKLTNLSSALTDGYNLHHTGAPGTGGGTCFGDSGGPVFSAETGAIVAITSFGLNANCAGGGFAYRVDIAEAASFINANL